MSWSRGNSSSSIRSASDNQQNTDGVPPGQRPLLNNTKQGPTVSRYGSVDAPEATGGVAAGRSSRRPSPEVWRRESLLNQVPEEESGVEEAVDDPEAIEWSLEEQGLYTGASLYSGSTNGTSHARSGSYRRIVAMHTFVPLSSLLLLGLLAYGPHLFWKYRPSPPESHPPYFPSPLPQFLVSSALWSLAYLLRTPLFSLVSFIFDRLSTVLVTLVFNILHVFLYNTFRVSSLPILRIRDAMHHDLPTWRDPAFFKVWWIALGWATIDVAVGIWQSYVQIALYRNVMVPEDRVSQILAQGSAAGSVTNLLSPEAEEVLPLSPRTENPKAGSSTPGTLDDAIRVAVDQDLEQLMNLKEREDVEEIYGLPVIVRAVPSKICSLLTSHVRKYPCSCPVCSASTLSCYRLGLRWRSPRRICTPRSRSRSSTSHIRLRPTDRSSSLSLRSSC